VQGRCVPSTDVHALHFYRCNFVTTVAGQYRVEVQLDGREVVGSGSALTVTVAPGALSVAHCTVHGPAASGSAQVDSPTWLLVTARDMYDNVLHTPDNELAITLSPPLPIAVSREPDGSSAVRFTPNAPGDVSATIEIGGVWLDTVAIPVAVLPAPTVTSAVLAADGMTVTILLSHVVDATVLAGSTDCGRVLQPNTVAMLGEAPTCALLALTESQDDDGGGNEEAEEGARVLRMTLGMNATVAPLGTPRPSRLRLLSSGLRDPQRRRRDATGVVMLTLEQQPTDVVGAAMSVVLHAPAVVRRCGDVLLDAVPAGGGGRTLRFDWAVEWRFIATCTAPTVATCTEEAASLHAALQRRLSALTTRMVSLPHDALVPGVRYTFFVRVTDWRGRSGAATATVLKAAEADTPAISLRAGPVVTASPHVPTVLTALVELTGPYTFNSTSGTCEPTTTASDDVMTAHAAEEDAATVALQWSVLDADGQPAALSTLTRGRMGRINDTTTHTAPMGRTRATLWLPVGTLPAGTTRQFRVTATRTGLIDGLARPHTAATASCDVTTATAAVRVAVAGGDRTVVYGSPVTVEALPTDPNGRCGVGTGFVSFSYMWAISPLRSATAAAAASSSSSSSSPSPSLTAAATAALFATPGASNAFGQRLQLPAGALEAGRAYTISVSAACAPVVPRVREAAVASVVLHVAAAASTAHSVSAPSLSLQAATPATLRGVQSAFDASKRLKVDCVDDSTKTDTAASLTVRWSVHTTAGVAVPSEALVVVAAAGRSRLSVAPGALAPGQSYRIKCAAATAADGEGEVEGPSATLRVRVAPEPTLGLVSILTRPRLAFVIAVQSSRYRFLGSLWVGASPG
jgi:hypothetical protein